MLVNATFGLLASLAVIYLSWLFVGIGKGFFMWDPMAPLFTFTAVMFPLVMGIAVVVAFEKAGDQLNAASLAFIVPVVLGIAFALYLPRFVGNPEQE